MLLGQRRKAKTPKMKEKILIYAFSEDKYIEYMNKLYLEKLAINNLLFHEPPLSGDTHIKALLCEQYVSCYHLEKMLEELEDSFDITNQEFYLSDTQAIKFTFLLSSLVQVKEELLKNLLIN